MLFNSYSFIFLFLPIVLIGYHFFYNLKEKYPSQQSLPLYWLAFSSLIFYTIWNPSFTPILLASITGNGCLAYALINRDFSSAQRRWIRNIGVIGNLVFLGYFKYSSFLLENSNAFLGSSFTLYHIILPLGISFYTFQKIALLVDAEKGQVKDFQLNKYLLFVTFFPQLIAGPLVHHKDLMPQMGPEKLKPLSADNLALGLCIFIVGLFKKSVLADTMAPIADMVFNTVSDGTALKASAAWAGALAYTLQLYFDFSGYSDMAIGLAMMFGICLPQNFNSPYQATSIIDFWRRWHMTLSAFLRDYVYIPLGGNKLGKRRRYFNLFLVMLIGALWHGAGWTFVLWGAFHGILLVINHFWRAMRKQSKFFNRSFGIYGQFIGWFITFYAVVHAWVLFRAPNFEAAKNVFKFMYSRHTESSLNFSQILGKISYKIVNSMNAQTVYILLILLILSCLFAPNTYNIFVNRMNNSSVALQVKLNFSMTNGWSWVMALLFVLSVLHLNHVTPFLYFQF